VGTLGDRAPQNQKTIKTILRQRPLEPWFSKSMSKSRAFKEKLNEKAQKLSKSKIQN
jgi:hypothetical protein